MSQEHPKVHGAVCISSSQKPQTTKASHFFFFERINLEKRNLWLDTQAIDENGFADANCQLAYTLYPGWETEIPSSNIAFFCSWVFSFKTSIFPSFLLFLFSSSSFSHRFLLCFCLLCFTKCVWCKYILVSCFSLISFFLSKLSFLFILLLLLLIIFCFFFDVTFIFLHIMYYRDILKSNFYLFLSLFIFISILLNE